MPRFFNTAGPCDPRRHYLLPPMRRLPAVLRAVEREQYFVLHAPRQSGKTTGIRALAQQLRAEGLIALWASLDGARGVADLEPAELIVLSTIHRHGFELPAGDRPPGLDVVADIPPGDRFASWLQAWCVAAAPRPIILFLDEVDGLQPVPLLSILSQLRSGYPTRDQGLFPVSVGLVGLRDLRDYVVAVKGGVAPGPTSPFNIKVESLTLENFSRAEVAELYAQHTAETGQPFAPEAVDRAWHWCRGQPLLVNALAGRCVDVTVPDRSVAVQAADIDEAAEHLMRARITHLDNLGERLREPRVARVMQLVILGDRSEELIRTSDDYRYVRDLGLLTEGPGGLAPANPMYAEVLTRQLTVDPQSAVPAPWWPWRRADGTLDFPGLMDAWRGWWRQHADVLGRAWAEGYPEAVPHLVLLAFLQSVVNGGGRVEREFASGRGRVDIVAHYGGQRFVVEVKRIPTEKVALATVEAEGLVQLAGYLDQLGASEGWLVIFDQRPGRTWDERMWRREAEIDGKVIHLLGG